MSRDLANGFLDRASSQLNDARSLLAGRVRYAETVSAAQESIELSAKAVFLLLSPTHPQKHEFTETEFVAFLERLPNGLEYLNFPRLYLLHRFWASFYTTAKYGLEVMGTPAQKLFELSEADLAVRHADAWYSAAIRLKAQLQTTNP